MKCFACDKKLGRNPSLVTCEDDQDVFVGSECYKAIAAGGKKGYQPPKGGPRLYTLKNDPKGVNVSQAALGFRFSRAKKAGIQ